MASYETSMNELRSSRVAATNLPPIVAFLVTHLPCCLGGRGRQGGSDGGMST